MRSVKIGNRTVGDGVAVFVIAEAGVNHNGSLEMAKKLIDAAKDAGADAVKFQAYKTDRLVTREAQKAEYQKKVGKSNSQYDLLKKLELGENEIRELFHYSKKKGIIFLASAFDVESVELLDLIGVSALKVASGEITNFPFLECIAEKRKPVIISTGMSSLSEIEGAVDVFTAKGCKDIILLHCVTSYPAKFENLNLKKIVFLKEHFNFPIGFSDHTIGTVIPVAAVTLGSALIEKHLTLDKSLEGPDHSASLEPSEFKQMVNDIRVTEKALFDSTERSVEEEEIKKLVRKSIVAKVSIKKGTLISEGLLDFKRPGTGISPQFLNKVVGKHAKSDIALDELVTLDKLSD
jgi:N,N'-diacetyllegionaminate synthase